ncbi:FlgM family anti-sigma-28 factor [Luteimonas cucumeris]|uniref:Negative regulator of flagellin synthesis n=1 Tax=Luteimonas cucumeris TaxID=985012 RepID=A0A562L586_9GAMM|nr:flagellar biosynthesis anti-sigma factor FlgM [Luteimonas cucumeris]TWI02829.1 FlgM family anti-sigma-28 factor [Luteimonas cucumeris]
MNQKIEGTPPPAIRSTTAATSRVASAGAENARPVEASGGGDSLRLTGEAASLQVMQRELSSASAVDTARVESIRAALQAGTYQINAEAIADGMLGLERQLGA